MPMDFPDMNSLIYAAEVHKFRKPIAGETEEDYRVALADHVNKIDFIESQEIRNKRGWNQWSREENLDMLQRARLKSGD